MDFQNILPVGRKRIVGLGSALMDILIHESDAFLEAINAPKGGMELVEQGMIQSVLDRTEAGQQVVPGGSACNTIIGVSCLGGLGRFVGKCGQDDFGQRFTEDLAQNGVEPVLFPSTSPTGRVLSIITADAQRTMLTYLGASAETLPREITPQCFENAAVVHLEGYLLFNQALMTAALKAAKQAGAAVSLDLASFTVVEQAKPFIEEIIRDYVDILIANEDEARVFTGFSDEDRAIAALADQSHVAVLKVGKRGSYIARKNQIVRIESQGGKDVVDTTGAGDLWAAGFLYGMVNGLTIRQSGRLGSICGYEVCRVIGASIPEDRWERIRKQVQEMH